MTENDDLQKISRFVEMGGTMTAQHCANCGAPMIRYQGKTFCPLCDVAYVSEDEESAVDASGPCPASDEDDLSESSKASSSVLSETDSEPGSRSAEARKILSKLSDDGTSPGHVLESFFSENQENMVDVISLINRKMVSIGLLMQDETDPRRVAEYLDIIEKGLGIMERYG